MGKLKYDYNVIVIGGGAAGTVAAEVVARAGGKVALIEQETLGGSVPMKSDIPIGALMTAAHALDDAHRASAFGLRTQTIGCNFPSLQNWKDLAIKRSGVQATADHLKTVGVETFHGRAHFLSPNEISIGRRHLTAEKFVVATGAKPLIPNVAGLDEADFLTSETAIDLIKPPKTLLIVGAGATGAQLAEFFSIFGTKVYLVDAKKRILPRFDEEVSELFQSLFEKVRGMEVLTSSRVIGVQKNGISTTVTYLNGETENRINVEKVLFATGLKPNTDLGLENAGVEYNQNGVVVDEFLQTSARNIWAAGNVLGRFGDAHTAVYDGKIAARNLLNQTKTPVDYGTMPWVLRLNPEIAVVGASEADLIKNAVKYRSIVVQNSVIARANTANFAVGFTKILKSHRGTLLGATIVCPGAGEMINELTLAIKCGINVAHIADTPHPFGSWGEIVRLACAKL
ncbi:NAD(P)/FAD-dependent oxidoreductase [Candidatus Saccharibacteria bacterium]|nr:NAD(P)/FAD-dependent oxidoreductase [Candidatus Saccharibacteria bacterium]MCL1963321.1 NAD(P)/FAD-dependent oxidoreductase [Candidatus Saccharibacteria bacterium]